MTKLHRHNRHTPSHVPHSDAPAYRYKRHSSLKAVTGVTLADVVPMPPVLWGRGTAAQLFLSLSRNSGGDC